MSLPNHRIISLFFASFFISFLILNSKFLIPEVQATDWIWGTDGSGNFVIKDRTTGVVKFMLDANGAVTTSRLSASNLSSGTFGSNTGGGNYTFPGNLVTTGTETAAQFNGSGAGLTGTAASLTAGTATSATTATNLASGSSPTVGTLYFSGVGGNSGQGAPGSDYRIYQAPGAWTNPYPDLNIAYHTGISIGAHYSYGGTRFFNNSDMVTELMSVGNGDNHVRVAYNLYVAGNANICQLVTFTGSSGTTTCPAGYYTWSGVGTPTGQLLCCKVSNPI